MKIQEISGQMEVPNNNQECATRNYLTPLCGLQAAFDRYCSAEIEHIIADL
jgi:hypothetical protein